MASSSFPVLMLPIPDETSEEIHRLSLYNLKDKQPCSLKLIENLENLRCVGSSHGWLAFLDGNQNPILFNPFTKSQIPLPNHKFEITKLILSQNPSSHPHTFAAVAMYTSRLTTKLSFCRNKDTTWRNLPSQNETYYDVVSCPKSNTIYALAPGPCVDSFDLAQNSPKRAIVIQGSCPRSLHLAREAFPRDLYSSQWYLAAAPGAEILLIVRYIGEFVRYDGEVVYEGDTLTDYAAAPVVCPYKTVGFRVFRVCGKGWADVGDLGDLALFLGGNETAAVVAKEKEGVRRNAIYFSDDYWERIDEDYSYGGHDFGVFCMGDGTIHELFDLQRDRIEPPPFWITHH